MKKYYFFDRTIIQPQRTRNFAIRCCKGKKYSVSVPFIQDDELATPSANWIIRYNNGYPNVILDPADNKYKLFITTTYVHRQDAGQHKDFPEELLKALTYAESNDGIHWVKPSLGVVEFDGNKDNNIVMMFAHGSGVMLDEQESDPAKRFKLLTRIDYPGQNGVVSTSFSPDGIHWQQPIPWPEHNPRADTHNFIFRDPTDNRFKLITRVWKKGLRISAMSESSDFVNWSEPKEILRGDGYKRQVYSMPVFRFDSFYLGLASIFHEGDMDAPDYDCVDLELTVASDINYFDFVAPKDVLIERGSGTYPTGDFDCGCIFAAAPIEVGNDLFVYYTGGNGLHSSERNTFLMRASFQKDRWAYLAPNIIGKPAEVMTSPFVFYGEQFKIIADANSPEDIEVALFGSFRDLCPIDGFTFSDAVLQHESEGKFSVRFSKPYASLGNKNVCIAIKTTKAHLYALQGDFSLNSVRG